MQTLDLTLPSPEENLALDEALLLEAEDGTGGEILRFWMSPSLFVVVGLGAKVKQEVHLEMCEARRIPVLRRCSGGGTVLQGPGCLNYALILRIPGEGQLQTISGTNRWIMQRNATALTNVLGRTVSVAGHTDLVIDGIKVSGNAQRRLRSHLLFHGTYLLDFDLPLIAELLPAPARPPEYRRGRSHGEFLKNLNAPADDLKRSLVQKWGAHDGPAMVPHSRMSELIEQRYARLEWNFRT